MARVRCGQRILDILESEDSQGLLDRVFDEDLSLRSLLTANPSFGALNAAIAHLRPISSVPRASLSPTAAQQLRFCNLATELLHQVAVPDYRATDVLLQAAVPDHDHQHHKPKRPQPHYALVQHIPVGDYWSSSISLPSPNHLQTANAELVAVLPTPSDPPPKTSHSLATYSRPLPQQKQPPTHRIVTTGAFLDYGPFASFAPSFDQDGELVGRRELGEVLFYQEGRKRAISTQRIHPSPDILDATRPDTQDVLPLPDFDLQSILPPEDVQAIKATLATLDFENSVQNLLERNQRALQRLEELQIQRLTKHPTSAAEQGSEEWDTAHAILDSLSVLSSLRPRSSSEEGPAIIPPPSVLHKLHRTLALQSSPGWYGTLPPGRTTALRDDSTVKVRPGASTATLAAPQPASTTATTTPATTAAPVSATNQFGSFAYAYAPTAQQQQAYRPQVASYTPYKPGQTPSYYHSYAPPSAQQQQGYYNQAAYATGSANQQPYGAATTGQQPYAGYSTWYAQYPTTVQTGTGSGRGTPQPIVATPATMATTYGSFFNSNGAAATPSRTPAVANTVTTTTTPYAQTAGAVPTLPAHLRNPTTTINGSPAAYQPQ